MAHDDVFGICRDLAQKYGHQREDRKAKSTVSYYMDPYGCDFEIICYKWALKKDAYIVDVYYGGMEVFSYSNRDHRWDYLDKNGHWLDLVRELLYCGRCALLGESYVENHTLFIMCRREAERNRQILDDCRRRCAVILKAENTRRFDAAVGKHEIVIMELEPSDGHTISLVYDKETVFSYGWGGEVDGFCGDKGKYRYGKWVKILKKLSKNM